MHVLPRLLLAALLGASALAHDGLELLPPVAVPEAWNVLTLCHGNVRALAAEGRWAEIGAQASLSIQAARFLREQSGSDPAREAECARLRRVEELGLGLFTATQTRRAAEGAPALAAYSAALGEAAHDFPREVVAAAVFSCPMCRGIRELDARTPCPKCEMRLEPRIIPASDAYTTPGEPSVVITPLLERPLAVGERSEVTVRLTRKKDGAPVPPEALRVVHTERIHLLIIDRSLSDYHHEHPVPTGAPGEYKFAITPRKPGPYRVFADLVPDVSRVQEYARCDLPGDGAEEALAERAERSVGLTPEGMRFTLRWLLAGAPGVRAKEPVRADLSVFGADGQPFRALEPIMGTYAHLVGFHEDGETVLHIHPSGGADPEKPTDRGGPSLKFTFFAPKPGFIRLYAQVQVGGVSRFAPFGVTVLP